MVSTVVDKKKLLSLVGADEKTMLAKLPDIKCGVESVDGESVTIEVTGDRPDLLSVYGIARAMKGYLSKELGLPKSSFAPSGLKIHVDPSVESVRPVMEYPVLFDAENRVLSLIPIINSADCAVTTKTRRVFIDHTGSDLHACNTSLNILCQDLQDSGATVKTVEVHYASKKIVTPDARPEKYSMNVEHVNKILGTSLQPKEVVQCLRRQRLDVDIGKNTLECFVPRYRSDFLQEVDLLEEVAMAYGYNNFEPKEPSVFTVGSKSADTYLVERTRDVLSGFGFQEVLTPIFSSPEKMSKAFIEGSVKIRNPVSEDYSSLRCSLVPGLLAVLARNTHLAYPQKVFEVGEVVVKDQLSETRTRTDLHAAFAVAHASSNLSESASFAAELCRLLNIPFKLSKLKGKLYVDGRAAKTGEGEVGEVHPAVLESYGLAMPVCVFEVKLKKGER
ncbi:phenylalanine--tRNA ligase subunit beta [Candidatus Micrarchaeota archaeon]|nr:phenylalanine--tRNA ligase subunit beta [Candidatus Micrarchaeota archaeon]